MSREISGEVGISQAGTAKGVYKTQFELPHTLKICEGQLILLKQKGLLAKEKWYMQVHQDGSGNVKSKPLCLKEKYVK
jgi:hypothetical protein